MGNKNSTLEVSEFLWGIKAFLSSNTGHGTRKPPSLVPTTKGMPARGDR